MKGKIASLCIFSACVAAAIYFFAGMLSRFSEISGHGFKLTEYWELVFAGTLVALVAALVAIIRGISLAADILRTKIKKAKAENSAHSSFPENVENPLEPSPSQTFSPEVEFAERLSEDGASDGAWVVREEGEKGVPIEGGKRKRPTRAQRRRQRLLREEKPARPKRGIFGIVFCAITAVFCVFYGTWAFFPNDITFHNYAYNTAYNSAIEEGEQANFRFYQNYLGTPYFLYEENKVTFKIKSARTERGEDQTGKYRIYYFTSSVRYAKPLDCALNKYSDLKIELKVRYYFEDSHIVVDSFFEKYRTGSLVYSRSFEGKIYTYKTPTSLN